jgi:hypothetical protein
MKFANSDKHSNSSVQAVLHQYHSLQNRQKFLHSNMIFSICRFNSNMLAFIQTNRKFSLGNQIIKKNFTYTKLVNFLQGSRSNLQGSFLKQYLWICQCTKSGTKSRSSGGLFIYKVLHYFSTGVDGFEGEDLAQGATHIYRFLTSAIYTDLFLLFFYFFLKKTSHCSK